MPKVAAVLLLEWKMAYRRGVFLKSSTPFLGIPDDQRYDARLRMVVLCFLLLYLQPAEMPM